MSDSSGWLLEEHTVTQEFRASHTPGTRGTDQQRRIRIFPQTVDDYVCACACLLSVFDIRHPSFNSAEFYPDAFLGGGKVPLQNHKFCTYS